MSKLSGVKSLIIKEAHDYLSDIHLINFLGGIPMSKGKSNGQMLRTYKFNDLQ